MDFSRYERATREWNDYLARNPKALVDGAIPTQSLTSFRTASNAARARWSEAQLHKQGLEDRFVMQDLNVPTRDGTGLRLRRYAPAINGTASEGHVPAFIHLHGGGYLNGSIETETSICAAIAVALNIIVLHPEYRHTDTVAFPTMFDDVWDAYQWVFDHADTLGFDKTRVVIGGQSAGSGLAAATVQQDIATSQKTKETCKVKGQVLTIPWLMHPDAFPFDRFSKSDNASPIQCANKTGLSGAKLEWFAGLLRTSDVYDARLNPGLLAGSQLQGTPKTAVLVAGGDPLRDQGLAYAVSLEQEMYGFLSQASI